MPHRFKSIKDKGGLAVHLSETRAIHRGFDYKMWRIFRTIGLNTTALAKLMNITFDTAKEWKAIDDREQTAKKAKADKEVDTIRSL